MNLIIILSIIIIIIIMLIIIRLSTVLRTLTQSEQRRRLAAAGESKSPFNVHLYYVFGKWTLKVKVEVKSESKKRKWKVKISKRKWQRRLDPWWSNFVWWSYEWNGESWSNFELWMRIFIVKRLDMTSENGSLNGRIRNDNNCATRTHLNEICNEWTWTILKINSIVEKPEFLCLKSLRNCISTSAWPSKWPTSNINWSMTYLALTWRELKWYTPTLRPYIMYFVDSPPCPYILHSVFCILLICLLPWQYISYHARPDPHYRAWRFLIQCLIYPASKCTFSILHLSRIAFEFNWSHIWKHSYHYGKF